MTKTDVEARRGTLQRSGASAVLRFERRLPHAPAKVWHCLTDPSELRYWFPARIEGERAAGAKLRFVFEAKPEGVVDAELAALIEQKQQEAANAPAEIFEGEITIYDPPRVLELTWGGETLRFELSAEGAATRLVFTHTLPDGEQAEQVGSGWHISFDWLAARLAGEQPRTPRARLEQLEAEYRS
jgi:uncharacterized protein YndB with AHSA1/START domain